MAELRNCILAKDAGSKKIKPSVERRLEDLIDLCVKAGTITEQEAKKLRGE